MWANPQFPANLVTFTEEIPNGKLNFFVQCIILFSHFVVTQNGGHEYKKKWQCKTVFKVMIALGIVRYILRKKWSFSLKISSVNVTKPAVSCGFGQIYWRNL